jgi:hypothetical protein
MAFQIKDFRSIVASMINVSRASQSQITDFSVGSVARTLMEASAIEIEELYLQMLLGLQEAIPTAVYTSFEFGKLPAVGASGVVRFTRGSISEAVVVPQGTRVRSVGGELEYVTVSTVTLSGAGLFADALVACATPGVTGNCLSGTLTELISAVNGITQVTNPLGFSNGRDVESDAQRKIRFNAYILTLTRGTISALEYGASLSAITNPSGEVIERARHIAVVEPFLTDASVPVGLVRLYLHNGVGATSGALVTRVLRDVNGYVADQGDLVPGWKAAGVSVEVIAAQEVVVNVTGSITMISGFLAAPALNQAVVAVGSYIADLGLGAKVVRSEIIALVMSIDGVYNVALSAPSADVTISVAQKAMPGTVAFA